MAKKREKLTAAQKREAIIGYLFITPWLVGFLVFVLGPMLFSLYSSFTNYDITSTFDWIGLRNYVKIFTQDQLFWKSMYNTFYYAVFAVPLGILVGTVSAVLLNQEIPGQTLFRTIFYLPRIVTGVSVLLLWVWIFNPDGGVINGFLRLIGFHNVPLWLADEAWSKPALIVMSGWSATGGMLIYLAGLQGIPKQLYEAAQIDGAGAVRRFFAVTIPLLSPTIFFKLVTGINGALQFWTNALVMTQGGPSNSTLFYGLYMYRVAFTDVRMGYAAALAWILLVITLLITAVQLYGSKRWVYYEGERR